MIRFLLSIVLLFAGLAGLAHADDEPLQPEQAFRFSARALDDATVEVRFDIADGYYLYKSKFKFAADNGVTLGEAQLPPGKVKNDENFGRIETYRGKLVFPLKIATGKPPFRLTVTSQGCADLGICYPPTPQSADIALAAQSSSAAGGGSLLARALAPAEKPAPAAQAAEPAKPAEIPKAGDAGNESGRVAGLLAGGKLGLILASFFGFGLLLAFTPCVFPMIPILSGIIVGHGHHISKGRAFVLSSAYALGMAVTYAAAGVAAGLSGTLLANALQNPWVLGGFAAVFVLLSLSMFGFYELQLPSALQSRMSDAASHRKGGSLAGVAAMGALSALIVGPCVAAPLAGALLYIAQTRDALLGAAALFVMALGMSAPLLVVGVLAHSLPKAGPWMEGVKKAFGVIMLGVAVWLVSPVVPPLASMLAWAALLVFSGIFLHALDSLPPHAHGWQRFWKGAGVIMLAGGLALIVGALAGSRDPLQPLAVLRAQAAQAAPQEAVKFERVKSVAELDARLKAAGRPVMLDFYADWCVSCKEMERFTFTDPAVRARMERMLVLQADVTANTDEDKALLARFKLFGPPGIIFFDAHGAERANPRVVGYQPPETFAGVLDAALAQ